MNVAQSVKTELNNRISEIKLKFGDISEEMKESVQSLYDIHELILDFSKKTEMKKKEGKSPTYDSYWVNKILNLAVVAENNSDGRSICFRDYIHRMAMMAQGFGSSLRIDGEIHVLVKPTCIILFTEPYRSTEPNDQILSTTLKFYFSYETEKMSGNWTPPETGKATDTTAIENLQKVQNKIKLQIMLNNQPDEWEQLKNFQDYYISKFKPTNPPSNEDILKNMKKFITSIERSIKNMSEDHTSEGVIVHKDEPVKKARIARKRLSIGQDEELGVIAKTNTQLGECTLPSVETEQERTIKYVEKTIEDKKVNENDSKKAEGTQFMSHEAKKQFMKRLVKFSIQSKKKSIEDKEKNSELDYEPETQDKESSESSSSEESMVLEIEPKEMSLIESDTEQKSVAKQQKLQQNRRSGSNVIQNKEDNRYQRDQQRKNKEEEDEEMIRHSTDLKMDETRNNKKKEIQDKEEREYQRDQQRRQREEEDEEMIRHSTNKKKEIQDKEEREYQRDQQRRQREEEDEEMIRHSREALKRKIERDGILQCRVCNKIGHHFRNCHSLLLSNKRERQDDYRDWDSKRNRR